MTTDSFSLPNLGEFGPDSGMIPLERTSDGRFHTGRDGVRCILATGDRKVEFAAFAGHTLALVQSALGYPAYYPVHPVALEKPVKAVLWATRRSGFPRTTCPMSRGTASPNTSNTASTNTRRARPLKRRADFTSSTHAAKCGKSSRGAGAKGLSLPPPA